MSENKNYYYLKMKENFFDSEEIKLLEAAENGYLYSNILLKLYLKSLKSEGRLMFRENIPYNNKMLATITGHNLLNLD
jgi:predicted phage replisome organizer